MARFSQKAFLGLVGKRIIHRNECKRYICDCLNLPYEMKGTGTLKKTIIDELKKRKIYNGRTSWRKIAQSLGMKNTTKRTHRFIDQNGIIDCSN